MSRVGSSFVDEARRFGQFRENSQVMDAPRTNSFDTQTRWAAKWGLIALAAAVTLLAAMYLTAALNGPSAEPAMIPLAFAATLPMFAGAVLLMFGVLARRLHRRAWFSMLKDSTLVRFGKTPRQTILEGAFAPFFRWWLHIDDKGDDRDRS